MATECTDLDTVEHTDPSIGAGCGNRSWCFVDELGFVRS